MTARREVRRLLIANRGEIAVRVARACRELGIESIAVFSQADRGAFHVRVADRAVEIGPAAARESYLRGDRIIDVAREHECDAIHPGYGFLSQNAGFADAVVAAGIVFVGPKGDAIRLMGDKQTARRTMAAANVPVVPGFEGEGKLSADVLRREAAKVGYPLLVKAAAGGGGRGMRIVRDPRDLDDAIESAGREAEKAFGDGSLFLERFLEGARHVEIQVLADGHGNSLHLLERECSVQRRYQKIIEESPSPSLTEERRGAMGRAAVRAAVACGYEGAGTVEFLALEDGSHYFLEMNTRLQVEHPVTELLTGIDIVQWQIRVAAGARLAFGQDDVRGRGHAIECRINAEDPGRDFAPSAGRILVARFPEGPGIRVDQGFEGGDEVPIHYDSLLAKLLVHAEDRPAAIRRMLSALDRTAVLGVATNVEYLKAILRNERFVAGRTTTTFVQDEMSDWAPAAAAIDDDAIVAMALADHLASAARRGGDGEPAARDADPYSPWRATDGFRVGG